MTEDEANHLLNVIGDELEDALRGWRYDGAIGSGMPHQIIPAALVESDEETTTINYPNHSGEVGPRASVVFELVTQSSVTVPVPLDSPAPPWDGSARRVAYPLEFAQTGLGEMTIYVNDPYGTIGGVGCCDATGGERPGLVATTGNVYALFKTSTCEVDTTVGPPTYDSGLWAYSLVIIAGAPDDWVPEGTFAETAGVFSGDLNILAYPNKLGFFTYGGDDYFAIAGVDRTFTAAETLEIETDNPDFGYGLTLDRTLGHPPSGAVLYSGAFPDCP